MHTTSKTARIKKQAVAVAVPKDAAEVSAAIADIGEANRALQRIEADMNTALAEIKAHWETQAEPHRLRIEAITQGVQVWCEAHRAELLKGEVKTATFPAGEVQWRVRPPSVRVTGTEAVMDALRRRGLDRFLRVKEEINKEAILNEPDAVVSVPGIRIEQSEDFVIKPFEVELADAAA